MLSGAIFLDRIGERGVLDSLLDSASKGTSGALVVYGEAGMGKSALLEYAASSTELQVAHISGVETERSFGFAALQRLLLPFVHQVDLIPKPQRMALQSAFGLIEGGPPDRFMVALGALTLLSVESSKVGLLCVIDDAQWIDMESLQALAFVARRLQAEGIALLFGHRTTLDIPGELAGIPALEVTGLPNDAAKELLRIVADQPVSEQIAERIATETSGCPLALWELGTTLTKTQSNLIDALAEPMPVARRLREHFDTQIDALSSDAQLFLLAVAADVSGDRALVRAATRALGCSPASETEAEHEGLILPGPHITFRHPLIRAAVYARADPDLRREVHRTFADLVPRASHPDRWARHVVLGATGPDARLASQLEETSQIARARGGHAAEASLLIQAAELTEPLGLKAVRLLGAAAAAMNAGDVNQAMSLLEQAELHLSDPRAIAEAAQLGAQLSIVTGQPGVAPRRMLEAARLFLPLDNARARDVLLDAFAAFAISVHFSEIAASDIARVANSTTPAGPGVSLEDHLLDGTSQLVLEGPEIAFPRYRLAAELLREGTVTHDQIARWSVFGIAVANELLDDRTYQAWAERCDRSARENGALVVLLFNLFALAESDLRAGDLLSASARYEEALDVAAVTGLPAADELYPPMSAEARAWAGDEEPTRTYAAQLIELNTAFSVAIPVFQGYHALAILHLGAGQYRQALEATEYVHTQSPFGFTSQTLPLAIEAATRSNEQELATSLLLRLDERAKASGNPWALGLAAQSRALLSVGSEAEQMYKSALAHLSQTLVTRDLAYARLLYGEWLRRENRRVDAREQLRLAHEFFVTMGAKDFAKRAEAELLATGERVRPRAVDRTADLTPQERRVASLAAEGQTNSEIAATLFLSSATIDYHLRKVYRKLNIESRRQLGKALRT